MFFNEYHKIIKKINSTKNMQELSSYLESLEMGKADPLKREKFTQIFIQKYSKFDEEIFPYIIDYYYSQESLEEFEIACKLLKNLYLKVAFLTNLESIKINREKFKMLLPVIVQIVMDSFSGIADCMYLILLNNTAYYDEINREDRKTITRSLYKIGMELDYLQEKKMKPTQEMLMNLEIMVDLAKEFNDNKILDFVERTLDLNCNEVSLFALNTLIYNNKNVSDECIEAIAKDPVTAERFYRLLKRNNRLFRFPEAYLTLENLSLSNMVNWLRHPAELGRSPDDIQLVKVFEYEQEMFYIYKYKCDLEKFKDKGYMIGISGGYVNKDEENLEPSGYTFSNFTTFVDEKQSEEECIKIIHQIKEMWKKEYAKAKEQGKA